MENQNIEIKGSNFLGLFIFSIAVCSIYTLISFFIFPFKGLFLLLLILPQILIVILLFRYNLFWFKLNTQSEKLFIKDFTGEFVFELKLAKKIVFIQPSPTYSGPHIAISFQKRYTLPINEYEYLMVKKILLEKKYGNIWDGNFKRLVK